MAEEQQKVFFFGEAEVIGAAVCGLSLSSTGLITSSTWSSSAIILAASLSAAY